MADKRISQLIERTDILNNDVLPIVASGATTTNKVTISTIQDFMQSNLDVGVTSVGLTMPSAFQVSGSPITTSGNITVTAAGTASQYIRGDGTLADFPTGGGGGSSVSYYLNGSVSQGTIGGVAYQELSKTPILGAGTDFNISADGYIASFITDVGDPGLLEIPAGNWNFETYLQASSGGGTPTFYIELYKVSYPGNTATLIASNSGSPELIAFGTSINPYFSALAVPQTTLALTDRLALRYYVTHSGRTITLHTENNTLCQVITTFTSGITALNGLTAQVQNFATGTSGTDFNISSTGSIHTFNLPDASASNRGAVTTGTQTFAGYKIFTGTIGVNNDIQLATQGTALNTFIKNINATGLTSIGSNGFGFNNANNIYFSGSSKGGGVFAFSNTGTQIYTLPDASGTIALTSNLSSYLPLSGGTLTGALNGTSASFNTTNAVTLTASDSRIRGGDTTGRLLLANSGTTTYGIFHGSSHATNPNAIQFYNDNTLSLSLASTGAATFSSSVTAGGNIQGKKGTFGTTGISTPTLLVSDNDQSNVRLRLQNTTSGNTWDLVGGLNGANNSDFSIYDVANNNTVLRIVPNSGAATFSGSLSVGGNLTISSGNNLNVVTGDIHIQSNAGYGILSANGSRVVSIQNEAFGVTGAATFSSSVTTNAANNFNISSGPYNAIFHNTSTSTSDYNSVRFTQGAAGSATGYFGTGGSTVGNTSFANTFVIGTQSNHAFVLNTNDTERMRITSGGVVAIGKTDGTFGNTGHALFQNGQVSHVVSNDAIMFLNRLGSNGEVAYFYRDSSAVGSISVTTTATSYNTSSDYRLKENVKPVENALSVLTQLKPCTFNFIADADEEVMGFIAHEVQEVIPQAVTGEKDGFRIEQVEVSPAELDEEGNIIAEAVIEEKEIPVYQGIDHSKLVPLLVAAIQEQQEQIKSLTEQVEALKSQING